MGRDLTSAQKGLHRLLEGGRLRRDGALALRAHARRRAQSGRSERLRRGHLRCMGRAVPTGLCRVAILRCDVLTPHGYLGSVHLRWRLIFGRRWLRTRQCNRGSLLEECAFGLLVEGVGEGDLTEQGLLLDGLCGSLVGE